MSKLLNNAIDAEAGTTDYKTAWGFLVDDLFRCSHIEEELDGVEKAVRIEAKKAARAEYREWLIASVAANPNLHEHDAREEFIFKYWNRVAELAGLSVQL